MSKEADGSRPPRSEAEPSGVQRLVFALLALLCLWTACTEPPAAGPAHLPEAWHEAEVDPATGGRFLPDASAALAERQAAALASGASLPYPHYADSLTVALAVPLALAAGPAGRRLRTLVGHEAADPELRILAFTDAEPSRLIERLDLGEAAGSGRLSVVRLRHPGASHVTFPFLRDYAPLVRFRPGPDGPAISGFVAFRQSRLNRVVDRELDVRVRRRAATVRGKRALTRMLIAEYGSRLGRPVPVHRLALRLDGGNLISDGRGTCFSTRVLLDKNGGDEARVRRLLEEQAGCLRTVFLEAPGRLDFVQHVDTLLYFADQRNAILSMPSLYESDWGRERRNLETLLRLGYRVHRVPRITASLTYTNMLTTRRHVYVPQYASYAVESDRQLEINARIASLDRTADRALLVDYLRQPVRTSTLEGGAELARDNRRAVEVVRALRPDRRVVPVESDETLLSLGSWHCLSHELPEAL